MFPCNGVTICFTYKGELSLTYPCNRTQVCNPLLCTEAAMSEAAKTYHKVRNTNCLYFCLYKTNILIEH